MWLSYLWWAWGRRTERDARTGRTCCRRAQRHGRTGRWGRSRALARGTDSVRGAPTPSAAFSSCMASARRRREGAAQAGDCAAARRRDAMDLSRCTNIQILCTHKHSSSSRVNRHRGRELTVTEEARDKHPPRKHSGRRCEYGFF